MKTVHFVRHGQSKANQDKVYAGWMDSPLTDLGREQAHRTAKNLKNLNLEFDLIISSPLIRAAETARIIAADLGYPVERIVIDERLKEAGDGVYAGLLQTAEIDRQIRAGFNGEHNDDGVETHNQVTSRIASLINDVTSQAKNHVILVGHDRAGRTLRQMFSEQERELSESVPNGAVVQLFPVVEIIKESL